MTDRFEKQIRFLIEIDKIKHVFRRTRLFDQSRYENDAEHGWHISIMALILAEYANDLNIDIHKVIKMALIHDVVEIDAGDTFLYEENVQEKKYNSEKAAAMRIFGLLPDDQRNEFIALWEEFEKKETPEARFAGSLDRLGPVMQNYFDNGHAWQKYNIPYDKVKSVNSQIGKGSVTIWDYARSLIEKSVENGNLKKTYKS